MRSNPKTGLTGRIRELLKASSRALSITGIYEALEIPKGRDRAAVWSVLKDLQKRGEIEKTEKGRFRYNHAFKKPVKGAFKQIILKAVYVLNSGFSVSDIQRLSCVNDKRYIQRIMRKLVSEGYISQVSRRICDHGRGIERVFTIVDRVKFRLDLVN